MGQPIFGGWNPILSNAVVSIMSSTVAQVSGAAVETYAVLVAGIPVLLTLSKGGRKENFGTVAERWDGTLRGVDARLDRADTRLLIMSHESISDLGGRYLWIVSAQSHAASPFALVPACVVCSVTTLELPSSFPTNAKLGA